MSSPMFLGNPSELIASVPAVLSFTPTRSIVLLFGKPESPSGTSVSITFAARANSPGDKNSLSDAELAHYAMDMCARLDAVAVVVVFVDDRLTPSGTSGTADPRHRSVIDVLARHLESVNLVLGGAWAARTLAPKAEWWDLLDAAQRGRLPDPDTSPVAVAYTAAGRTIHRSRSALADLVTTDTALRDRVAPLMLAAAVDTHRRWARAAQIGDLHADTRRTLWHVMHAITTWSPTESPDPQMLAEVAVALRDRAIRDVMFGVAAGAHAARAEQLWSILTRALPDPDRAQAATLLAFHAYLRGDGPLAGIALGAALSSDPKHLMARLLHAALTYGMDPTRLHQLCRSGIEAAAELRIDIVAPQQHSHPKKGDRDTSR
ncbi:DUF4192 domain-containing protein [Nocardia sp. NPDC059246]|uniref:DUF4192 domain-containing protein n=1 Tax=unclassified Nocardia TaxID=2637762 RepID=UPI0036CE960D